MPGKDQWGDSIITSQSRWSISIYSGQMRLLKPKIMASISEPEFPNIISYMVNKNKCTFSDQCSHVKIAIINEILSLIIVHYSMLFMISFLIFYATVTVYKHWNINMKSMTISDVQFLNYHMIFEYTQWNIIKSLGIEAHR